MYNIVTSKIGGRPLATLHELQTIYSCQDVFDMLEIIDVHFAFEEMAYKEIKKQ